MRPIRRRIFIWPSKTTPREWVFGLSIKRAVSESAFTKLYAAFFVRPSGATRCWLNDSIPRFWLDGSIPRSRLNGPFRHAVKHGPRNLTSAQVGVKACGRQTHMQNGSDSWYLFGLTTDRDLLKEV